MTIRAWIGGGDLPKGGGVTLRSKKTKILGKNCPKRPIFGAEGAENFWNTKKFEEFEEFQRKLKFIQEKIWLQEKFLKIVP